MTSEDCMQRGQLGGVDTERNNVKDELTIILIPRHSVFCSIPGGFSDMRQNFSYFLYQFAWVQRGRKPFTPTPNPAVFIVKQGQFPLYFCRGIDIGYKIVKVVKSSGSAYLYQLFSQSIVYIPSTSINLLMQLTNCSISSQCPKGNCIHFSVKTSQDPGGRGRQNSEYEASLAYRESSWTARAIQRNEY